MFDISFLALTYRTKFAFMMNVSICSKKNNMKLSIFNKFCQDIWWKLYIERYIALKIYGYLSKKISVNLRDLNPLFQQQMLVLLLCSSRKKKY
jgi:hypothetical protein